ncbi:DNA methyltransferase, partial [Micromonas pusilla CCMP1545]
TQFGNQHGLVAIGMVAELLNELNGAFCDQTLTREYKCDAYEDARQRLWFTFANDYICGVDETQWSSGVVMRNLAVQEQFEYLLSQCETRWDGDLVAVVEEATVLFLAQSTLNRPDIKAVVIENDRKAGRNETLPTDDLYALHPGFYEDIAPATTNLREPAVATWRVEVDLDGHTPYAEGGVPRPEALAAREGTLLAEDGPTEQYPAEFARKMSQGAPGKALYEKTYQVHPDPRARWDAAFCASKGTSDASCYPRVTPKVGYTHDANGRRLLTNQGQPLPTGYVDANEPRM